MKVLSATNLCMQNQQCKKNQKNQFGPNFGYVEIQNQVPSQVRTFFSNNENLFKDFYVVVKKLSAEWKGHHPISVKINGLWHRMPTEKVRKGGKIIEKEILDPRAINTSITIEKSFCEIFPNGTLNKPLEIQMTDEIGSAEKIKKLLEKHQKAEMRLNTYLNSKKIKISNK